jgi:hypothetical protein
MRLTIMRLTIMRLTIMRLTIMRLTIMRLTIIRLTIIRRSLWTGRNRFVTFDPPKKFSKNVPSEILAQQNDQKNALANEWT